MVCDLNNKIFAKDETAKNILIHEHIYNTKSPIFYFCFKHAHQHVSHPSTKCIINHFECCEDAVSVLKFTEGFAVTTTTGKVTEYTIYDPSVWRDQSINHFMSFIRAVITAPDAVPERYKRFTTSRFDNININNHISGKGSYIRTSVTGFETLGIYQTSIISCKIKYYEVILPQKLYDLLETQHFDLDYVMVKRDPSILPTCMYVCAARRNVDSSIITTVISDQQSKGLNQDQDGDKNAIYFLRKQINGYDCTKSYWYKVAKMELAAAFRQKKTFIGNPRYLLSENSLLKIGLHSEAFIHIPFFRKTYQEGPQFMNDAAASYLSNEYDEFQDALIQHNKNEIPKLITVDDVTLKTPELKNIVESGAKGDKSHIKMLLEGIMKNWTILERKRDMLELYSKYITSSQNLSRDGRKQFAALYAAHDFCSEFTNLYINKKHVASYKNNVIAGTFQFNKALMRLGFKDLQENLKCYKQLNNRIKGL